MDGEKKMSMLSEIRLKKDSPLIELLREYKGNIPERDYTYADFTEKDMEYDIVRRFSVKRMEGNAEAILRKHRAAADTGDIMDAEAEIFMFGLNTEAYCVVYPPFGEGASGIVRTQINELIEKNGICYGIDHAAIDRMVDNSQYLKMVCIARGEEPVHGMNGFVEDHYSREYSLVLKENEEGIVDFKDLNWIIKVNEGDILCDITYATKGKDGMSVLGNPVHANPGKEPKIPQGQNTSLSEDGRRLMSDIKGQLFFKKDKFVVDNCLNIDGDVGAKTGHIDAYGDVIINGNIISGYKVKATGNVTVLGMSEGAEIYSGGDVFIGNGMAGDGKGYIEAEGSVKCKYMESATVKARGSLFFESVINSDLRSEENIYITSGAGIAVGGKISAAGDIRAKVFGNDKHVETKAMIVLPEVEAARISSLENEVSEMAKKFKYESEARAEIAKKRNLFELHKDDPAAMQRLLKSLPEIDKELDMDVLSAQIKLKQGELDAMIKASEETAGSCIYAEAVNPGVKIRIIRAERSIEDIHTRCVFKKEGPDIVMKNMDEDLDDGRDQ